MNKEAVFTLVWWAGVFIIAAAWDLWKKHKQRNRRVSQQPRGNGDQ